MNTNMTGFSWFSKIFAPLTKEASAFEGLKEEMFSKVPRDGSLT